MINIIDATNLYLSSKAMSQSIYTELVDRWFEPLEQIAAQMALQQMRSNPVLERQVMSNPETAALAQELGG